MTSLLPASLLPRLTRYSLGVGAGAAAAACLPGAAQATVFEYDVPNGGITGGMIFFDLESAASTNPNVTHVSTSNFAGADFRLYINSGTIGPKPTVTAAINGYNRATIAGDPSNANLAARIGGGQEIGEGIQTFNSPTTLYYGKFAGPYATTRGNFPSGTTGFLGLRLDLTPVTAGVDPNAQAFIYYGWAEVSYNSATGLTLSRFAYEDSGANIFTPVPEPNAALLLVAGAAGLGTLRSVRQRRKKQQQMQGTVAPSA